MKYAKPIQDILDKYTCNIQSMPDGPPIMGISNHDVVILVNEIDRLMELNAELRWQIAQLTGKTIGWSSSSQSG